MALTIRNQEAEEYARTLARMMGESKTRVVTIALQELLIRERHERADPVFLARKKMLIITLRYQYWTIELMMKFLDTMRMDFRLNSERFQNYKESRTLS